jgi:hypothetical protein
VSDQQHPYAGHPAALVLADHLIPFPSWSSRPTRCDCRWTGPSCDHPAHLAEMLQKAGLLKEDT